MRNVATDEGLDLKALAERLRGYTGADVTNVCRDASMMAMRRRIAGKSSEEIRRVRKEEIDLPVTEADFLEAGRKCKRTVGDEDAARYERWMEDFGSS